MLFRSALGSIALLILASCAPTPPSNPTVSPVDVADAVPVYRAWVLEQADRFLLDAEAFAAAIEAGDRTRAQALYAPSRMPFERIEPIAEALGDFDPRLDAREGDVPDAEWRGFHRIEKILWSTDGLDQAKPFAKTLVDDVRLLRAKVETAEITVPSMVTGAVELLNEISTSKVTGEEERYSHTDLYDFQANLEGAEKVWLVLKATVLTRDPELAQTLETRFSNLQGLLDVHRRGAGFRTYTEVSPAEVKALAAAVDALAEPLSQLSRHFPAE